ncbi:MAG: trigger factor [Bacteroidales bacterium]
MNITREDTGNLSATICVELSPEDYSEKVVKSLKELQKKSNLKGFRPGKVPFGLIKKMYGTAVRAEEINKVLSESLTSYIRDEKLDIIGYPLANEEKNEKTDFAEDQTYQFYFDLGLSPEFKVDLSNIEVTRYKIQVEDSQLEEYLKNVRNQHGNTVHPEKIEEHCLVKGTFVFCEEDGDPKPEKVNHESSFGIDFIKNEEIKNDLMGCEVGTTYMFSPLEATGDETETASMLGISKENRELLEATYYFDIEEISKVEPAEVNEELFKKVYPNEEINTEEEFLEKLREEAASYFQRESDNFFVHEALEKIVETTQVELPDEFVKRWLADSNENLTLEEVEKNYESYSKNLKRQLIINQIAKDNNIEVSREDVAGHISEYFARQFGFDVNDEEKKQQLNALAQSVMQNEEEVNRIYDQLFDDRMRALLLDSLKISEKEVTYDQFIKEVDAHHHTHHHDHDHDHDEDAHDEAEQENQPENKE